MPISSPYKFSDWYGYDKDFSSSTDFQSSSDTSRLGVCSIQGVYTYTHNGSGPYPAAGDSVFDQNGNPVVSGHYKFNSTFVYKTTLNVVDSGWPQDLC
jgi:hypothetical protein